MANQGIYHPTYNPNGSKKLSDGNFWYNTAISINSTMDCFDSSKMLANSGNIGTTSGRPDGIFYDQIAENSILDLRNSSKKVEDYNRLINREFNKLVAGTNRGKEGEWQVIPFIGKTLTALDVNNGNTNFGGFAFPVSVLANGNYGFMRRQSDGKIAYIYKISTSQSLHVTTTPQYYIGTTHPFSANDVLDIYLAIPTTRTKSNTLLHCDIIGNPANYPTSWKQSGVFGTPLLVAEDGTSLLPTGSKSTFKLSRKANATPLLCLRSTDSGVTWTSFTPTFSTTTNEITLTNEPAANLVMVYYQTHTSMAVPTVNSEVLEIGDIESNNSQYRAAFVSTLIGKIPTYSAGSGLRLGTKVGFIEKPQVSPTTGILLTLASAAYSPTHSNILFGDTTTITPAVKVFPYLTRTNGKAFLNLVFKEMKHNGTSWGDDAKFNIVDNVSTTTDNNAQTVLIGQKTVELNVFIGADE